MTEAPWAVCGRASPCSWEPGTLSSVGKSRQDGQNLVAVEGRQGRPPGSGGEVRFCS